MEEDTHTRLVGALDQALSRLPQILKSHKISSGLNLGGIIDGNHTSLCAVDALVQAKHTKTDHSTSTLEKEIFKNLKMHQK